MKGSILIKQALRDAIRNVSKLHRQWLSSKSMSDVKAMIRKSKSELESNIGTQSKINPKIIWPQVRTKLKIKTDVVALLQDEMDKTLTKFCH